ncbi:MAG: murein L,D-transpeptidase catalytic domain-containing protein, partial [Chitinophagaceae bacterium]
LKLQGMERGINDNAYDRGIVVHAADYVNQGMAKAQGWIGRSYGCPALPTPVAKTIINNIKYGTCLFIYHPSYIKKSVLLS